MHERPSQGPRIDQSSTTQADAGQGYDILRCALCGLINVSIDALDHVDPPRTDDVRVGLVLSQLRSRGQVHAPPPLSSSFFFYFVTTLDPSYTNDTLVILRFVPSIVAMETTFCHSNGVLPASGVGVEFSTLVLDAASSPLT